MKKDGCVHVYVLDHMDKLNKHVSSPAHASLHRTLIRMLGNGMSPRSPDLQRRPRTCSKSQISWTVWVAHVNCRLRRKSQCRPEWTAKDKSRCFAFLWEVASAFSGIIFAFRSTSIRSACLQSHCCSMRIFEGPDSNWTCMSPGARRVFGREC